MIQTQRAAHGIPHAAIYFAAAIIASIVVSATLLLGNVRLYGPEADPPGTLSPAVLRSARMWEAERLAQMGYVDPVLESGREWERQRRQQSIDF